MKYQKVGCSRLWPVAAVLGAVFVQGCAGRVSSGEVASFDGRVAQGDYTGASAFAISAGKIGPDGASDNLLWSLNAGAASVYGGDHVRTIPILDRAEEMMKLRDVGTTSESGQYRAKTYDGVMTNVYKAIAAMQEGRSDVARTELLRAEDRQRRAEDQFASEVAAADAKKGDSGGIDVATMMGSVETNSDYRDAARDMGNFGGYKPFINPLAYYLNGLYFLNTKEGDPEKARMNFEYVRAIQGRSTLIDGDLALLSKSPSQIAAKPVGKASVQPSMKAGPKTWVIVENGQGPTLTQYSITFPVPLIGRIRGASVATVALPRLHDNLGAAPSILVGPAGERTIVISNFDYVVRSEFARRYPSIIRNAVLEAALKVAIMNAAAQEKTGIALLVATVASNVSTADVRSWSVMPKDFQAARINTPMDGIVTLRSESGADLGSATVPTDAPSIVYVKMMRSGSPPSIQVLRF